MADELNDFSFSTRVGPLAIYQWVLIAGAVGFVLFKLGIGKLGAKSNSSPGQGSQFQSSQTKTTTDANGNQTTTSYSATGDGFLPGMLTMQGNPMPYSLGDIYINNPVPTTTPSGNSPVGSSPNEEPYLYGHQELDYIKNNETSSSNPNGYTPQLYQDVLNAYMSVLHSQGQDQADAYHYSWIGPGNVQAIPQNSTSASQTLQNLP